ncbi:MAG: MscL family protein [archaeon]
MAAFKRFVGFLKEYRIIAISVSFIIAIVALNFIQSIVNDIILPLVRPIISSKVTRWEDIILSIGSANIRIGSFLSALFSLLLIVLFLYIFVERVLQWKPKK